MSRVENHIRRWRHNRKFLGQIPDGFPDWMVTATFYTAVHAIEALFAHDKLPASSNHDNRRQVLRSVNRYQQIYKHFDPLYQASRVARYQCDPNSWLPVEDVKSELIPRYLYPLEQSVRKLIKEQATLFEPVWPEA